MLGDFITYLNEQIKNMSIYVWGAQGQKWPVLCEKWIKSKEANPVHRANAIKQYKKACAAGHEEDCRAFDCSGLGMYWLQNVTHYYASDMNANGMMGKCKKLNKSDLKKGDWVFRVYKSGSSKGRAYHIGYIVDTNLNVIEAKGRAYGVVISPFDSSYWNAYGRPEVFRKEIEDEPTPVSVVFRRLLKKGMSGNDVKELQRLLNAAGGYNLAEDGQFGTKTYNAVRAFQKSMGLTVDGIAGKNTIKKLGGIWEG